MIVKEEIFVQIMEWGLNGVPNWEIIERLREKFNLFIDLDFLENIIRNKNDFKKK